MVAAEVCGVVFILVVLVIFGEVEVIFAVVVMILLVIIDFEIVGVV